MGEGGGSKEEGKEEEEKEEEDKNWWWQITQHAHSTHYTMKLSCSHQQHYWHCNITSLLHHPHIHWPHPHLFLLQHEVFRMIHVVSNWILHPDPPRVWRPTDKLVIPLKLWGDLQTHSEHGTCDWLDGGSQWERGETMENPLYNRTHLHMMNHVTWQWG